MMSANIKVNDTNQNFSRIVRAGLADENGTAVADDVDVDNIAARILTKHIKAFEELAK